MLLNMKTATRSNSRASKVSGLVRQRIMNGGERLWRLKDFEDLSFQATAQALSRLMRAGYIERIHKGVYYHAKQTTLGKSLPNSSKMRKFIPGNRVFPSGIAAANLLGFTTQNPNKIEIATNALSLPRMLVGRNAIIHTRRPEAWSSLREADAALLDFLRQGGKTSELSPEETIRKTLKLLSEEDCFERLMMVAIHEPPRVKALLGALGEQLGKKHAYLEKLKKHLNPFSKFDFGLFGSLKTAAKWNAKPEK